MMTDKKLDKERLALSEIEASSWDIAIGKKHVDASGEIYHDSFYDDPKRVSSQATNHTSINYVT